MAVRGPRKGHTFRCVALGANVDKLGFELIDDRLALKVEDLDAGRCGGAEPVAVGREAERVDNIAGLKRVEVLALVKVPEHRDCGQPFSHAERTKGMPTDRHPCHRKRTKSHQERR